MIMHKKGGKAYARDGCRFSFVYLSLDFMTYSIFSLTLFKHTREWNAEISRFSHADYQLNVLCLDFIVLVWGLCCKRCSVHKSRRTALESCSDTGVIMLWSSPSAFCVFRFNTFTYRNRRDVLYDTVQFVYYINTRFRYIA